MVSERRGADGGDDEGGVGATGDSAGCRVRDDPRIRRQSHRRVALPGGRGKAGLAGEVINRGAGGGTGEYGRTHRWGVSPKEGGFKPGAVVECVIADAGDAGGDRDARQPGAVLECVTPDAGDAVWDRYAGQPAALIERSVPDAGDACGDRDVG